MDSNCKVHKPQGGDSLDVEDGGVINLKDGGKIDAGSIELERSGSNLLLSGLPTADPEVAGALWNSSGTVKVSAGS